jgi:glyoxylase-like metal-dependent hydrolase (beta-lactamase superfamily II)
MPPFLENHAGGEATMKANLKTTLLAVAISVFAVQPAQGQSAQALIEQAAKAMGGLPALRALNNQAVESEGKQFDSSSTARPLGPTKQISTFHYSLTRDLKQPRLRLQWNGRNSARNQAVHFAEIIDGAAGVLLEDESTGSKPSLLHAGRLATRLREEKRSAVKLILLAAANKSLRRLDDAEIDGIRYALVAFTDSEDTFRVYFDENTRLPVQCEILEDDPLEGDSSYLLRYGDWRKVDDILLPFSLRYELNGKVLQEEQLRSVQHNLTFIADPYNVPAEFRAHKTDVTPIASQWILRRVAGNVSYHDLGRPPAIQWITLAVGVYKMSGSSHATIVIEMNDHLIAVEGPLYEARTAPVIRSIKERFADKPIRYVIPTHHHLDHAGGIRAFMAEGAIVVTPFIAGEFYRRVAKAPHTRRPDSLERVKSPVVIETFGGGFRSLADGKRTVEIHPMPTAHAEDLVVVYLPAEKMVIEADHISPRNGQVRPAPLVREFVNGLDRLGLEVDTIVGIHGDSAPMRAARAAAQVVKK